MSTGPPPLRLYQDEYVRKQFERIDLFKAIVDRYGVKRALYPGSYVHVSPSFVIPTVAYVDTDRRCPGFFSDHAVLRMVMRRRRYDPEPQVIFHHADYTHPFGERTGSFDLLISQWAGPVTQACRRYLRRGGIALVNDSHGDASLAYLDRCYELVAAVNRRAGRHRLGERNLGRFFRTSSGRRVTRATIEKSGRGPSYTESPSMYVFRRRR